ncbi:hypothetical protein B0H14DRAFT_2618014 [Mycena olivaceomarginata]|nr:hypothetical protein B0H14DRAFT_2618014 [Mycena olivaceomarginata]
MAFRPACVGIAAPKQKGFSAKGLHRASFMWGSSTHTPYPRLWVEVGSQFARRWRAFFYRLEALHGLDHTNPHHLWAYTPTVPGPHQQRLCQFWRGMELPSHFRRGARPEPKYRKIRGKRGGGYSEFRQQVRELQNKN